MDCTPDMLVGADGKRIDAGPIEIVFDRSTPTVTGTPEIVNGISCISCHRRGMIDFTDELSEGHGRTSGVDQDKICKNL